MKISLNYPSMRAKYYLLFFLLTGLIQLQAQEDCNPDVEPPQTMCQNNYTVLSNSSVDLIISPELIFFNTSDNCTALEDLEFYINDQSTTPPVFEPYLTFPPGTEDIHTVEIRVLDEAGNTTSCDVTVFSVFEESSCDNDGFPPTAVCDDLLWINLPPGESIEIEATQFDDGSADNCTAVGDLQFFVTLEAGTSVPTTESISFVSGSEGEYLAYLWIVDEAGNTNTCVTEVTVEDFGSDCSPDITVPAAVCDDLLIVSQELGESVEIFATQADDGSSDNCTAPEDLQFFLDDDLDTAIPTETSIVYPPDSAGEYILFLWVMDEAENYNSCAVTLIINNPSTLCDPDIIGPVAVCQENVYVDIEPGETIQLFGEALNQGSFDNCTPSQDLVFYVTTDPQPDMLPTELSLTLEHDLPPFTAFVWVTDAVGNSNFCASEVVINGTSPDCDPDENPPAAFCTEMLTVSTIAGEDFGIDASTVISGADNCSAPNELLYALSTNGELDVPPTDFTLNFPWDADDFILYSYVSDEAGNFSVCSTQVETQILQGVSGYIFVDSDNNCLLDDSEEGIGGYTVRYTLDGGLTYTETEPSAPNGNYSFVFQSEATAGELSVELLMPDGLGNTCVTSYTYALPLSELEILDFPVQLTQDCAFTYTDISAPFLRRCFPTPYTVSYCNYSTQTVENVEVRVFLDPAMVIEEVSLPYTITETDELLFTIGSLESGECGLINISVILDCTTTLGATKCVQASITPHDCNEPGLNWTGASLAVAGECDEDAGKVNFSITNEGTGPMSEPLPFIVVEDVVMYMQSPIQLDPGESEPLEFEANGATRRVQIDQEVGHPSLSAPTAFVEGCGGYGSTGIANQFAQDELDPFIAIDCQEVIAAYDPNDKRAFPEGYSDSNFIEPNTSLEYNIRFQNTGTDTAFTVRIEDQIDELLDVSSIEAGASSHPYRMELQEDGLLIFHFDDIMLPDSNVNEVASHGFVQFRINQKPDNALGEVIENTAEIYFDFNEEIITNTVFHTLGENFVISETQEIFIPGLNLTVAPNPLQTKALFTLTGAEVEAGSINLFDLYGRLIMHDSFIGNQYELMRNNLASGTYFFRLSDSGKQLVNGKLIVR